jgi:hypothetical protein
MSNSNNCSSSSYSNVTSLTTATIDIEAIETTVYGYVIPAICLVGIALNIINLLVLVSPQLPQSTYVHLTGLAIADLTSLCLFATNALRKADVTECPVLLDLDLEEH